MIITEPLNNINSGFSIATDALACCWILVSLLLIASLCKSFKATAVTMTSKPTETIKIAEPATFIDNYLKERVFILQRYFLIKKLSMIRQSLVYIENSGMSHPIKANRVRYVVLDDLLPVCENATTTYSSYRRKPELILKNGFTGL